MVFFALATSRAVVGRIAAGAISGAMLFAPSARLLRTGRRTRQIQHPRHYRTARRPTWPRFLRVWPQSTSGYLFSHPDVNTFFTSLKGQQRSDQADQIKQYMDANPQTHTDLEGIRQPLTDFRNRCNME